MNNSIGVAFDALRRAVERFVSAVAALVIAALAALLSVLAALAVLARGALLFVAASASAVVRVAIAGALVVAVVWAWPVAWQVFGGDVAAMIPASMLVVLPVALSFARRAGWPGLLAAVFVISVLAVVLSSVTHPALVAFVVLVAVFVHFTTRRLHHA